MKRFIITEEEKSRILNLHSLASKKFVVSEAYEGGLVMQGDKICDIVCKNKYAGVGAKGDIVKMIQHTEKLIFFITYVFMTYTYK